MLLSMKLIIEIYQCLLHFVITQFKSKLFSCYNILENYAHMTQYEVDIMYEVKLDAFNGPLDLLLHLIQKFEIDIYDIPMQALTEQYMQYVHAMKQLEINIASEYLSISVRTLND